MPKPKSSEPMTKHTMLLAAGSYQKLSDLYSDTIGAAGIIRLLIDQHLKKVEAAAEKIDLRDDIVGNDL